MSPASKAGTKKGSKPKSATKAAPRKKAAGSAAAKGSKLKSTKAKTTKAKASKAAAPKATKATKATKAKATKAKAPKAKAKASKAAAPKAKAAKPAAPKAKAAAPKAKAAKPAAPKAAAPKAKAAKKSAPARKRRKVAPKVMLAGLLEKLERCYGAVNLPSETESTVEKAVYLVLREGGSQASTERAMRSLREDFVDWNDVRLSRPSELARLMSNSSKAVTIRRLVGRCERIREMLDQIYNDRNEVDLEFLLDEKPKGQIEYLEDIDDLGIHNAYALSQWLSGEEKLVLASPELCGVCQKFLITESAAVSKVRKELSDLLASGQSTAVQAHLNQLGDMDESDWPGSVKDYLKEFVG